LNLRGITHDGKPVGRFDLSAALDAI